MEDGELVMKNITAVIFLIALVLYSCDSNNDVPSPNLPPAVYGQLPTRSDIIKAAEAVGASNVEIISYQIANDSTGNSGGITTNGGIQPNWWKPNVITWKNGNFFPTLTGVKVVYNETNKMHSNWTVKKAIQQLFENSGFTDTWYPTPFVVETTTDNCYRLIPLPTHADIINTVEQLGASNVNIDLYFVYSVDFWAPPPFYISGNSIIQYFMHKVPSDSNFYAAQGNIASPTRTLVLSYSHPGLGIVITNSDVVNTVRKQFKQYGFEVNDIEYTRISVTGTLLSASFPLPSYSQVKAAAEQAGANDVQINLYKANNIDVIPLNEGTRLAEIPIIIEINYDGPVISNVNKNVNALFANFNTVYIGNNTTVTIPLPSRRDIWLAASSLSILFLSSSVEEPRIYTVESLDANGRLYAVWDTRIKVVMYGNSSYNTIIEADNAKQAIIKFFNGLGFFNLDITVFP